MTARGLGRGVARLGRALDAPVAKARAAEFARRLKAEYEAGKAEVAAEVAAPDAEPASDAADATAVAEAIRGVDWAKVRAATSERGADAAQAMKSMAAEVDWAKVQPVAAKVSSALIAAVASGQLGIGGRAGSTVARAIMNDRDLAQRVSSALTRQNASLPPDFREQMGRRGIDSAPIETTATD